MMRLVPTNRTVPLLRRQPLDGPYAVLSFRHPEVAREARPGQFVMIKAGVSSEPPLRRPFSILAVDPAEESVSLFLKAVGPGSRALAAMAPGDLAQCLGPLGRPFEPPAEGSQALLVAGGYGIAPFLFLGRVLAAQGRSATVFYGGRTAADLQLRAPFDRLSVSLVLATEDGSLGVAGRVTVPLEAHLDAHPGPATLYACGPEPMLHAVARLAEARGLEAQVSLDPWMGCGLGTCLGCVVRIQHGDEARPKYRCACTEGPAFDASNVLWGSEAESLARRRAEAEP
jgi:dihydroorotate dehydrogenase electron transfer subunit